MKDFYSTFHNPSSANFSNCSILEVYLLFLAHRAYKEVIDELEQVKEETAAGMDLLLVLKKNLIRTIFYQ